MSRRKLGGGVCGADGRVWIEQLETRNLFSSVTLLPHPPIDFAEARAPESGFSPAIIRHADAAPFERPGGYYDAGSGNTALSPGDINGSLLIWSARESGGPGTAAIEGGADLTSAIDPSSYGRDSFWAANGATAPIPELGDRPDFQLGGWSAPTIAFAESVALNLNGSVARVGFNESWNGSWNGFDGQSAAMAASSDGVRSLGYPAGSDMGAAAVQNVQVVEQVLGFAEFHNVGVGALPWAFHFPGGYDGAMDPHLPDTDTVIVVVGGLPGSATQLPAGPAPSPAAPVSDPASGTKTVTATQATRATEAVFRATEPPTPLALTPENAARSAQGAVGAVQPTGSSLSSAAPTNGALSTGSGAFSVRHPATLAAVFFGTAPVTRQAALVADGVYAATGLLPTAAAQAPEALSAIAAPPSLAAHVAYNFLRLDPSAIFPDTIAAFVNEWASIPSAVAQPSAAGAWAVTAAVLALDAVLLGAWYRRTRRGKQEVRPDAFATTEVHIERLAERWM